MKSYLKSYKVRMPRAKLPRLTPKVKIYGRRRPSKYVPKHMQTKSTDFLPMKRRRRKRKKSWIEKLLEL